MWYCNSLEHGVWDVGQVWMGHMHDLSKSEGEYGGTQETQTELLCFEKSQKGQEKWAEQAEVE